MDNRHEREFGRPAADRPFVRGVPPAKAMARRSAWWLAGAGVLFAVLVSQLSENGVLAWRRLESQEADLQREVVRLHTDNDALEERLAGLRDDPEVLERIAREKYGLKMPGEDVIEVRYPDENQDNRRP